MTYIDFHAHLDFDRFNKDRKEIVTEIKDKNIIVFTNTLNPKNYFETKEMFKLDNHIKVCPGLYPQDAEEISDDDFNNYLIKLENMSDDFEVIGEVGLDKYHTKDNVKFEIQKNRFFKIIEFAHKLNKPLCIHTRNAEEEVLEILSGYIKKTGFNKFNLHCFMGKKKLIAKIKELGISCSIPLTILNTQSFQILVKELPISQLLVETDSPFLNPDKSRNTPLNVPIIYNKIAEIKGLDKKEIEYIIYRNFQKLVYL